MTGFIIWKAENVWKFYLPTAVAIAAVFGTLYFYNYFTLYPRISEPWFDTQVKQLALETQVTGNWRAFMFAERNYGTPLTRRYYLMRYGHRSCDESAIPMFH